MKKYMKINGKDVPSGIWGGPMGVGVTRAPLSSAIANEGGVGILSIIGLDRIWSRELGYKVSNYEAIIFEAAKARTLSPYGVIGLNIMVAVMANYHNSVEAAVEAKRLGLIDIITIGAGLIKDLPEVNNSFKVPIAVIVSSARAAKIVLERWKRNKWSEMGYELTAFIVEGPKAGGHLGFKRDDLDKPECQLEAIVPEVKQIARENGDIYVIAAGGIFTRDDITDIQKVGADGVQMATIFLASIESSASDNYKMAVINTKDPEDIIVSGGSPCGMLFRVLRNSPMYQTHIRAGRKPKCSKGYLLRKDDLGNFTICGAKTNAELYFCICNGLLASAGSNPDEEELYTSGSNAYRVESILSVKTIMDELKGSDFRNK